MKRRFTGVGIALCFLFSASFGQAASAEAEIGLTANLAHGVHAEETATAQFAVLPFPILSIRHRSKRLELFAESLVPIGPIRFIGGTVGQPQSSQLGYLSGVLRYYTANGRLYVGAGASEIVQRTVYVPFEFTHGSFHVTDGEIDTSRLAGARYEVGALLADSPSHRIRVSLAALPSIRATLNEHAFTAGSINHSHDFFIPEHASLVDTSISIERTFHNHVSLVYGVRYVNVSAAFEDGSLADRNRFVAPFVGITRRI
ncbi:MAG: hypothetical protein M3N19_00455 [Candidatus Eremiobacteraeota bacterium]|nr:hypothetical protein [Candidatus Eremiobacteraeota bacterium]